MMIITMKMGTLWKITIIFWIKSGLLLKKNKFLTVIKYIFLCKITKKTGIFFIS